MSLADRLQQGLYQGYAYGYPHKLAYRPISPMALADVWREEPRASLFLYVHIPFCEMRCGFCNLFTVANPAEGLQARYLRQFSREAGLWKEAVGEADFSRIAVGGGTPSFLDMAGLSQLFFVLEHILKAPLGRVPFSFELSPGTIDEEKLAFLRDAGVTRASMGVQSFLEEETRSLGRPQPPTALRSALKLLRHTGFPMINLDLIYGASNQSARSWAYSLEMLLDYEPEDIYLYPLYVRPLTGLGKHERESVDRRAALYTQGRDFLLTNGYQQKSMRHFRKASMGDEPGPVYRCSEDGMVGLGAGARSYTRALHYSSEYAVGRSGVRKILEHYLSKSDSELSLVAYGFALNAEERWRRTLIKSLLCDQGLAAVPPEFAAETQAHLEQLRHFDLAHVRGTRWYLTDAGFAASDVIGPWLYSPRINHLIAQKDLA